MALGCAVYCSNGTTSWIERGKGLCFCCCCCITVSCCKACVGFSSVVSLSRLFFYMTIGVPKSEFILDFVYKIQTQKCQAGQEV